MNRKGAVRTVRMEGFERRIGAEARRQAASGGKRSQASALQRRLAPSDDGGYGLGARTRTTTRTIGNGFAFWTVRGNPNDIICEHDYD